MDSSFPYYHSTSHRLLTVVNKVAVVYLGVHALRRVAAVGRGDQADALLVVVGRRVAHRLPLKRTTPTQKTIIAYCIHTYIHTVHTVYTNLHTDT